MQFKLVQYVQYCNYTVTLAEGHLYFDIASTGVKGTQTASCLPYVVLLPYSGSTPLCIVGIFSKHGHSLHHILTKLHQVHLVQYPVVAYFRLGTVITYFFTMIELVP